MAFDLSSVSKSRTRKAPRIVIYGPEGIGKSTFGASAPSPIFLPTEDGIDQLDGVASFPLAKTYKDIETAIESLLHEQHEFASLVIDTLDWLEPLLWDSVCSDHKKSGIESFGYGKGYTIAADKWRELMAMLNDLREQKNMAIILAAHSQIKRFDDPVTDPYDRYKIKLHEKASAIVREWSDILGFASQRTMTRTADVGFDKKITRGITTGERLLWLHEQPAFEAKTRYKLPESIPLSWDALMIAMKGENNG